MADPEAPIIALAPLAWWAFRDLTTLFQGTDEATPVTADGQPIGRVNDKSGNGYHHTQGTAMAKPTYKVAIQNGLSIARFNGANLLSGAVPDIANGPYTIYSVAKSSLTGQIYNQSNSSTGVQNLQHAHINTGVHRVNQKDDGGTEIGSGGIDVAAANGVVHRRCARRNGTAWLNRVGATQGTATATIGTSTFNTSTIGARQQTSTVAHLTGDIHEIILFDEAHSDAEMVVVQTALDTIWGL